MANTLTERIRAFRAEFERRAMAYPSVEAVEFFGSITDPERFRRGSSDIDVAVYGDVPQATKHDLRLLVRDLNDTYALGLEDAPFLHPVPFFVEPGNEWLFRVEGNGHVALKLDPGGRVLSAVANRYRGFLKDVGIVSYADFWRFEDKYLRQLPAYDRVFYRFW